MTGGRQMTTGGATAEAERAADQLAAQLHTRLALLAPLAGEVLVGAMDMARLRRAAGRLVARLATGDAVAARDVMSGLWAGAPPPAQWWADDLGRALLGAWVAAGAAPATTEQGVAATVAAAQLGVTRARVYQLIGAGALERHPGGGVTASSTARLLAERHRWSSVSAPRPSGPPPTTPSSSCS